MSGTEDDDLLRRGMAVRRRVLGDDHVNRASAMSTGFDAPFQEFIARTAWGSVWARSGLTARERSMITIAILAALGREEELALHLRATINTGASMDDVREALMHVGVYAGVPAANTAFRIAKRLFADMEDAGEGKGNGGQD